MKKLLTVLLALVMVVTLAGCGAKEEAKTPASITYLYNTGSGHQAIAEYCQGAWAQAGVNVNLENQEWATFLNTRKDGNYTVARNGWLGDFNDPISFLDMWTTASGNNDVQFGRDAHKDVAIYSMDLTPYGYEKVENGTWAETYDKLIGYIKTEVDQDKRFGMMHVAEDILMETGCLTPIYYYTDIYMLSDKISGFYCSPLGYKFFQNTTLSDGGTVLPVCIASEPDNIDPAFNSAVDGATLDSHLFEGIAKLVEKDGKLVYVAACATELPEGVSNADGTITYTYTLKDGLKWSDGQELKASDFEFAWKRAAATDTAADYGYMFEPIKGYPDDLAVVADDAAKTLTVTLNNYTPYFEELLAFPTFFPVREDVVANEAWATDPSTFICNGPYKMTAWEHNSVITLEKNPNYIDADTVTMPTLKFFLSDDDNAMLANYKNGDWLMIDSVPNAEIKTLQAEYPTEYYVGGQLGTYYICWNVNADLLGSAGAGLDAVTYQTEQAAVRKAFSLLLDRNYVVDEIGQAGQLPASSFVALGLTEPDGSEFYKNAGHNDGFVGYYDVSAAALESNCAAALEVINKYFGE
ncbi:MAG: ABC transporter substrate-binding protein [Erysipelotrichaceae bacterium]|nr:ABC transporter substrate-binding protein [Erysipelotrichaceae bacterium]